MKRISILVFMTVLMACSGDALAQSSIADTSVAVTTVDVFAAYHSPGGDLADRFGSSGMIGGGFRYKAANKWVIGASGGFFFGSRVTEPVALGVRNSSGFVIDTQGRPVELLELERGVTVTLQGGRLFEAFGPNPNSGILVMVGGGMLQHKILLESRNNDAPAIEGDYLKGYDRLSNGFTLHESVGYQYMSNNRLVNLYVGIEAYHAWTQSRRDYNYDLMARDETKRNDSLYGLRVIWSFPIYSRSTSQEYYR